MKHYEKIENRATFGKILKYIFDSEDWFENDVIKSSKSPQTSSHFEKLIRDILSNCKRPSRNIRLIWTVRNYAIHVCDPDTPYFFNNVEEIFHEIIIAYLFYLRFREKFHKNS